MPRLRPVFIGLGLALVVRAVAWAEEPPLGGAWISAIQGEALVQLENDGNLIGAALNVPLLPGDRLQAGPTGRIEVLLSGGTAIHLGPSSAARLVTVPPADAATDTATEVDLEAGRIIVVTGDGERSRPLVSLNAPGTRIQIYPQSRVRADVVAADATDVFLKQGAATADTLGVSIPLRVAEVLRVGRGETFRVAGLPQDDFDRWSESRDRVLAAAPPSSPYVPPPLAPYVPDLSGYGQWTTVREYGYVWRPNVVVTEWAPFTDGRWVWRGGTWVWLPREPWGWVPYHYGRWRWDPILGWYWVPPRPKVIAWCPGAVAWIQTPSYVTWIPLAPGEIYYSPWPSGPWSAPGPPVTPINIIHAHITKVFVNAAAPGPVVAVPLAAFTASTFVGPQGKRAPLSTLTTKQTFSLVMPAAVASASAAGGVVASPVTTPVASVGTNAVQPKAPTPSAMQAIGQKPATAPPAQLAPNAAGQASVPASWPTTPARTPLQPKVDPERGRVQTPPSTPAAPPAAKAVAPSIPVQPPVVEGSRPREDHGKHEARAERREPRVEHRDPRWFSDAQPPERPAARIDAAPTPVQSRAADRQSAQQVFAPSKAPERQRNVIAATPHASAPPTKAHHQPTQQSAPVR